MSQRLFRLVVGSGAALLFAGVIVVGAMAPSAGAAPSMLGPCVGDLTGGTFTLTVDCDTTVAIVVPSGVTTVDGGPQHHIINAHDTAPGSFVGGVLTVPPGQSVAIQNLTIQGTGFVFVSCARGILIGIWFNDASGSVTNVTVDSITEDSGCVPLTGIGIRADGVTAPRTVTITKTNVTNYQRNGIDARGSMTMDVSGSTVHPEDLSGVIGQNGVVFAERFEHQPSGSVSGSTIFGIGDVQQLPTPDLAVQPSVLVAGATNVTITNNTLTSDPAQAEGPDGGVIILGGNQDIVGSGTPSTGIVVSFNHIERAHADGTADPTGIGVFAVPHSETTLICNTFSNWKTNVVGAIQLDCTPLPDGAQCATYSAQAPTVDGGTEPFTWSVSAGSLPPGLTLASDGSITGTPTDVGAFKFTLQVVDSSDPTMTGTADFTVNIAPGCATTTTTPGAGVGGEAVTSQEGLARTGGSQALLAAIGLLSLLVGAGLTLTGRYAARRG